MRVQAACERHNNGCHACHGLPASPLTGFETGNGSWWGVVGHRQIRGLSSQGSRCHAGRSGSRAVRQYGACVRVCAYVCVCASPFALISHKNK